MPLQRLRRILAQFRSSDDEAGAVRMCEVCARIVSMTGAGIILMSDQASIASVCSTDEVSALIDELQYTLGEGPSPDAYRLGCPVFESDLASPVIPRWVAFSPPAVSAGVRAVFTFPLRVGSERLGVLSFYRNRRGPLMDDQQADAIVLASVVARILLTKQGSGPRDDIAPTIVDDVGIRSVVHQATGMVAAQLQISVAEATSRLRGFAFSTDRTISEAAEMVVSRTYRFEMDDDGGWPRP